MSPDGRRRPAELLLPIVAIALMALTLGLLLANSGTTQGYDLQAYLQAGQRLLYGQPLYDPSVDVAGGFAIYLYPPPLAFVTVPLTLLPATVATWTWTVILLMAFAGGVALFPVNPTVRWIVILLAALSWPFLYAIKLGQVEPLLVLAFGAAWRWRDRQPHLGAAIALGAAVKLQPGLLFGWALASRRWQAVAVGGGVVVVLVVLSTALLGSGVWGDYTALLLRVSTPVTTPHNFTPGAIAYQAGLSADWAGKLQLVSTGLVVVVIVAAWLAADREASLIATVVATQLVSPLLWDHYAVILLLPVAYLLERRQWWAALIPIACWLPAAAYPVLFWIGLVGPLLVGGRARRAVRPTFAGAATS